MTISESLSSRISEVIDVAEEMALMSITDGNVAPSEVISERLAPSLMQARTYVEVGMISAPEVRSGITDAAAIASDLADAYPEYARLFSMLNQLREFLSEASRQAWASP